MRTPISDYILGGLSISDPGATTYTAPGGSPVPVEARVRDVAAHLRTGGASMITHQAEATVAEALAPQRGGVLTRDGVQYVITGVNRSPVPGLLNLGLRRVGRVGTEAAISGYADLVLGALESEIEVRVGGQVVPAQVNRSTEILDDAGLPIEDRVVVLGLSVAVADTLRAGDTVQVDAEDMTVQKIERDGRGLAKVAVR